MDGDKDFNELHALVTGAKGFDQDVAELRTLVKDYNAKRLHAALDRVLAKARERRTGRAADSETFDQTSRRLRREWRSGRLDL
jgi:DNA-binding LytR/AlgR family response regulator